MPRSGDVAGAFIADAECAVFDVVRCATARCCAEVIELESFLNDHHRVPSGEAVSLVLLDRGDPMPRIVLVSGAFEQLTGYSPREAVEQNLGLLTAEDRSRSGGGALRAALKEAREVRLLLRSHRKNGEAFWEELSLFPLFDSQGRATRQLCIRVDVTRRMEASRDVEPSLLKRVLRGKQEWESTVDALPDLVFLVEEERRVVRANRTIESWGLGSVHTVRGHDLHDVLHPGCSELSCQVLEVWDRLAKADPETESLDCDFTDAMLRRRINLSMHRSGTPNAEGEPNLTTVVVRDCSAVYAREEVRRRKDRLDTMEHVLGGLAHEVGNPIAAMKITLDVWRRSFDGFDRDTHERYLSRVEQGLDRLRASVDRVLSAEQKRPSRSKHVLIRPLLERVHSLFADQAAEAGIDLVTEPLAEPDAAVSGDSGAIDDILTNLIKNALEACEPGARVSLRSEIRGTEVLFQIQDGGAGISTGEMERLFLPFFTTKPTGTGLGLTLANQLTQQMGGRLEIKSAEGVGTTATLHLPLAAQQSDVT